MNAKRLTLVQQPQDFFRELITDALDQQKIQPQPETEFYLVHLLNRFMTTDVLFGKNEDGSLRQEPLAVLLQQALEEEQSRARAERFKQLGDVSLYVGGYFQESLNRKLVDVDYYIEMGAAAYLQAAVHSPHDQTLKPVYEELGQKFAAFIEVLANVSEKTTPRSEKDILRIYELWVRTKSEKAAKALQEAGILPNETIKKDWQ